MPNIKAAPARAARLQAESKPLNIPPTANRITRASLTAELVTARAQIAALERGLNGWKLKARECERLQGLLAASRTLADQTAAKLARSEAGAAELAGALRDAVSQIEALRGYLSKATSREIIFSSVAAKLLHEERDNDALRCRLRTMEKAQHRQALELVGATLAGAAAAVLAYHLPLSAVLS